MKKIILIVGITGLLSGVLRPWTRDNATGIVSSNDRGLEWQDNNLSIRMTWKEAIDACESLDIGGYTDWRLPNLNELTTLVEDDKINPAINDVFQNTHLDRYWSSTTYINTTDRAWSVYFDSGVQSYGTKNNSYYVRCVRDLIP